MNKPHKHAEVIKAWADGARIECRCKGDTTWLGFGENITPRWLEDYEYRVKPEKKTAGQVYWDAAHGDSASPVPWWVERGVKAVIEAYKRGEIEDV